MNRKGCRPRQREARREPPPARPSSRSPSAARSPHREEYPRVIARGRAHQRRWHRSSSVGCSSSSARSSLGLPGCRPCLQDARPEGVSTRTGLLLTIARLRAPPARGWQGNDHARAVQVRANTICPCNSWIRWDTRGSLRVLECCFADRCEERVQHCRVAPCTAGPSKQATVFATTAAAWRAGCDADGAAHPAAMRDRTSRRRGRARIAAEHLAAVCPTAARTRVALRTSAFISGHWVASGRRRCASPGASGRRRGNGVVAARGAAPINLLGFLAFWLSGEPFSRLLLPPIAPLEQLDADGVRAPASACHLRRWPVGAGRN
jgi:hypothetical protein